MDSELMLGLLDLNYLFIYLFTYRFVQCTGERTIGHVVPYLVHQSQRKGSFLAETCSNLSIKSPFLEKRYFGKTLNIS